MSVRERFKDFVRHGGSRPYVSLQLGAGAGFEAKLAGKEYNSDSTAADVIAAYEKVGCDPLFNIGLPDLGTVVPALQRRSETVVNGIERVTNAELDTPYGTLRWQFRERPREGVTPTRYPVSADDPAAFDIIRWYAEQHRAGADAVAERLAPALAEYQPYGPVSVQWNVQPFELFGLPSVDQLVMLAMLHPADYRRVCDDILAVNLELLRRVFEAGADFIFLGGPGAEMMSPDLYERYLVPDSQKITAAVRAAGGMVYTHICSPIEPFLSRGYYGHMGLDLFETLSPPPVGNVRDLAAARDHLGPEVCTRGNIGLDVLLNGSVAEVEQATVAVLEATRGTKHMVAASDYLFYPIPLENAQAVVKTVAAWAN